MSNKLVSVKNLYKTYQQAETPVEVLKGLNLEISEGETIAILGQSGSGKTTFLSLLAGLDRPDSGEVMFCGHNISTMNERELTTFRARNLSIVFQQFHLMTYLNALENVALPLEIAKIGNAQNIASEALHRVGLAQRLTHLPQQLSGGEKQRVAIARAIVAKPKLLLADEPSGNLDAATGDRVVQLLFEQVKTLKMSLVLVTHNDALANRCDRKLILSAGVLK
jgi:putative ABC transport system ATP-binding protein